MRKEGRKHEGTMKKQSSSSQHTHITNQQKKRNTNYKLKISFEVVGIQSVFLSFKSSSSSSSNLLIIDTSRPPNWQAGRQIGGGWPSNPSYISMFCILWRDVLGVELFFSFFLGGSGLEIQLDYQSKTVERKTPSHDSFEFGLPPPPLLERQEGEGGRMILALLPSNPRQVDRSNYDGDHHVDRSEGLVDDDHHSESC